MILIAYNILSVKKLMMENKIYKIIKEGNQFLDKLNLMLQVES